MENTKYKNEFTIRGRLLSASTGKTGRTYLTVLVTEIPDKPTFPSVVLASGLKLPENIHPKMNVFIKGYVEGYNARIENGKLHHFQRLVATRIEPGRTEIETIFGEGGVVKERSKFRSYITGELVRTIDINDQWAKIVVKALPSEDTETVNYIVLSFSKRFSSFKFESFEVGAVYNIYARVSTPKKELDGKKRSFNDLLAQDVAKVEK